MAPSLCLVLPSFHLLFFFFFILLVRSSNPRLCCLWIRINSPRKCRNCRMAQRRSRPSQRVPSSTAAKRTKTETKPSSFWSAWRPSRYFLSLLCSPFLYTSDFSLPESTTAHQILLSSVIGEQNWPEWTHGFGSFQGLGSSSWSKTSSKKKNLKTKIQKWERRAASSFSFLLCSSLKKNASLMILLERICHYYSGQCREWWMHLQLEQEQNPGDTSPGQWRAGRARALSEPCFFCPNHTQKTNKKGMRRDPHTHLWPHDSEHAYVQKW